MLKIYIDGASKGNPGPAGIGVVVKDEEGRVIRRLGRPIGEATNNIAEYRALLEALKEAHRLGGVGILICSDSELLVKQINGIYKVRAEGLLPLFNQARAALRGLRGAKVVQIPRRENKEADALARRSYGKEVRHPGGGGHR